MTNTLACTRIGRVAGLCPQRGHVALPGVRQVLKGGGRLEPQGSWESAAGGAARRMLTRVRRYEPWLISI